MIYKGAFQFDEENLTEDDLRLFEGPNSCCIICGSPMYCEGGESHDADGILAEVISADFEKNCDCTLKDLLKYIEIEEFEPLMETDKYGDALFDRLSKYPRLNISEYDIDRMSEYAEKTFKELCDCTDKELLMYHSMAYQKAIISETEIGNT